MSVVFCENGKRLLPSTTQSASQILESPDESGKGHNQCHPSFNISFIFHDLDRHPGGLTIDVPLFKPRTVRSKVGPLVLFAISEVNLDSQGRVK
jgi:hypothetical protein